MNDPLWEKLAVAAAGPVVAAALAVWVLNGVTKRVQERREAADARNTLASELTETANSLYLALQSYWRAARDIPLRDRSRLEAIKDDRERLDAAYQAARARGQVLEQQLKIYFASPEPSASWHRVTDLLTVRYFLLFEADRDRRVAIRTRNAGENHSGLTADELNNPTLVLETYRTALAETIASLWNHKLDVLGKHLSRASSVATWHGTPTD